MRPYKKGLTGCGSFAWCKYRLNTSPVEAYEGASVLQLNQLLALASRVKTPDLRWREVVMCMVLAAEMANLCFGPRKRLKGGGGGFG